MTTSLCGRSAALLVLFSAVANAQVHYHPDGGPWKQRARKGPDAVVDGWYYNLGETGIRVQLMEDTLHHLLVKHVFEGSPAHGRVKVGDVITGAGGRPFKTEHWNGYGMKVFGPEGPLLEFSKALSAAQSPKGKSKLLISLKRDGTSKKVSLKVGQKYGAYAKKFPEGCPKSEKIVRDLLVYLTSSGTTVRGGTRCTTRTHRSRSWQTARSTARRSRRTSASTLARRTHRTSRA